MARLPLLASLLVAACSVQNPYFGVSSGVSTTDGASGTTTSSSTGDSLPTTGASSPATTTDATSDDPTGAATLPPPPDLPSDNPISDSTSAATTTTTTTGDTTSTTSATTFASDEADASDESDSESMPIDLPPCDPTDPALLACYTFDDVNTLDDSSMYGHDGTLFNAAGTPGVDGQALRVSGGTIGTTTNKPDLSPETITMSAWVRLTKLAPEQPGVIVEKRQQYSLGVSLSGPTCTIGQTMTVDADKPLTMGEWTHVACTYKDGVLTVFVDGLEVATAADDMAEIGMDILPLNVGCGGPGCGQRLLGADIDRVQLWKTRLTDAALCAEANPKCP